MHFSVIQVFFLSFCVLNLFMPIACDVSKQNLLADGEAKGRRGEAPRFNLAQISNNFWRVPDSSIEGGEKPETFYTRREAPARGALLIKSEFTGLVFLYNPVSNQLELSTNEKWEASTDTPSGCVSHWGGLGDAEQPEFKAVLWKKYKEKPIQVTVDISGRHQWGDMLLSPSKRKLAVFSFDGQYKLPDFLRRGQIINGDRHIDLFEVLALPDAETTGNVRKPEVRPIGEPIVFRDPSESTSIEPCWTADEEFILIPDATSSAWIWIAEVKS